MLKGKILSQLTLTINARVEIGVPEGIEAASKSTFLFLSYQLGSRKFKSKRISESILSP